MSSQRSFLFITCGAYARENRYPTTFVCIRGPEHPRQFQIKIAVVTSMDIDISKKIDPRGTGFSDKKLDNDDKVLTANTVNSFQRAWATPERAKSVLHFLLHHDYFNLLRGACAQH